MELFKNTDFPFLRYKWPFITASVILSVAGLASIVLHGGLKYGIDFKGGAQMTVKFASPPPLEKIRSALSQRIKGDISVQDFTGATTSNEVVLETQLEEEKLLNVNRQAMADVLTATFGQPNSGKLDFNNAGQQDLFNRLRDPLAQSGADRKSTRLNSSHVEISYAVF